jgi:ligand-binding sensor domain-containing protein/serine phosphatase RsbU (regulator of sigma subunit)
MSRFLCFLIILWATPFLLNGQAFRFNQYTSVDGISQDFIYSINQDEKGYLWVGTGEGLCRFDGQNFTTYSTNNGLAESIITCSYIDSKGNIWYGHNEGGITKFKNGKFSAFKESSLIQSTVNDISALGSVIYFVTQNEGVFAVKNGKIEKIGLFQGRGFYSIECIDEQNMIVGTSEGLCHLVKTGKSWRLQETYLEENWIADILHSNEKGIYLLGLQKGGLKRMRLFENKLQFSQWEGEYDLSELAIKTVLQDNQANIWLGTYGQGLVKLHTDSLGIAAGEKTVYNMETGMSSNFVQSVFQDREGNIWVGTFGDGLSTLIDDFFTFYAHDPTTYGNNVTSIWVDDHEKWYGVDNGLILISPKREKKWSFYTDSTGLVNDAITALYRTDSIMWIGTRSNGAYYLNVNSNEIRKIDWKFGTLEKSINQITGDADNIWIATNGGIVIYDRKQDATILLNTRTGLAHNSINSIYKASNGKIYMGTHSRFLYAITNEEIEEFELTNAGETDVVSIIEDKDGTIWMATAESGVYRMSSDTIENFSIREGLKSNYCYAIQQDANGNIWVGHRGGLSKINKGGKKIEVYDHKSGIKDHVNQNAMFLDGKDYLWIGTDGGAIKYDGTKDKMNDVPPVVNLLKVLIGDKVYDASKEINLPYGNYRIQFEYIGVSFKDPDQVKYQFQLVGHDEIFSDMTEAITATYGRISDGSYTFKVTACNENGICTPTAATVKITIAAPIWKKWWFYLILVFIVSGIVIAGVRYRLSRLKANQIKLEEQLAIKTKEVVEKAERIEEINKDLTDSINYAERIQSSILPDVKILQEALQDSFIFYRPRDIVSGDFYFVQHVKDKLIIGCVDCTGHGVPGAFMSMIGSVTLRNIYTMANWEITPEKVLEQLDKEVELILQQRADEELTAEEAFFQSRDGMDLSLCEVNLKTNEVLLASAMRTSIIQRGGELEILSGDKRTIGGGMSLGIEFKLQRFQMKPGDALYLFSDGYTDQFGGAEGRKLKLSGAKKIVEGLSDLDRVEYGDSIATNFDQWQADWPQIDDVLFIGLMF